MYRHFAILALCLICGVVRSQAFDKAAAIADFMAKAEICAAEVGSAQVDMDDMVKKQPASTKEGKCLRACIMKQCGVMNAAGKLNKNVCEEHAKMYTDNDPAKMKIGMEIIGACEAIEVPSDHCEAAVEYLQCFEAQAKAHGIEEFDM